MENKTLNTIQGLSKAAKIISRIVFVFCIIGAVGCLVGIITLAAGDIGVFKIGGVSIHGIIEKSAEMSVGTMYADMAAGFCLSIAEMILALSAVNFFKLELSEGTPFSFNVAKGLKKLGISAIVIPIVGMVLAQVSYVIINRNFDNVADMHIDDYGANIGLGIVFIIVSIVLKYGAEQNEKLLKLQNA